MAAAPLNFAFGAGRPGLILSPLISDLLTRAAAGGAGVSDWLAWQRDMAAFVATLGAPGAFQARVDDDGKPNMTAVGTINGAACALEVTSAPAASSPAASSSGFSFQGKTYNVVGSITATFAYENSPAWCLDVPIGLLETAASSVVLKYAYQTAIRTLLTTFCRGLQACFGSLESGAAAAAEAGAAASSGEAGAAAQGGEAGAGVAEGAAGTAEAGSVATGAAEAGTAAAADAGAIAAEAAVSVVAAPVAFAALVATVALPLIGDAIEHPTAHTIQVYNLTAYDITWTLAYLDEGALAQAPVTSAGGTEQDPSIPGRSTLKLAGVGSVGVVHQAVFVFRSTSDVHGLGYVFSFAFADASGKKVATATVSFDIPFSGDNSLAATFQPVPSAERYYDDQAGETTQTQLVVNGPSGLKATVTYDYLSDEHPDASGQSSYSYNSQIIFS